MQQSETIGKLAEALSRAQGAFRAAKKDSINPFFNSKYASLSAVFDACREALSANELAVIQTPIQNEAGLGISTMLAHSSGEWARGEVVLPISKEDAQGYGSLLTYARRYGFMAMVGAVSEEEDDDGNHAVSSAPKHLARSLSAPVAEPHPKTLFKDLTDIMPVGKYKGKTIQEILDADPKYLDWAISNMLTVEFSSDLRAIIQPLPLPHHDPRAADDDVPF